MAFCSFPSHGNLSTQPVYLVYKFFIIISLYKYYNKIFIKNQIFCYKQWMQDLNLRNLGFIRTALFLLSYFPHMVDFVQNNYFLICSTYNALTISVPLIRLLYAGCEKAQSKLPAHHLYLFYWFFIPFQELIGEYSRISKRFLTNLNSLIF